MATLVCDAAIVLLNVAGPALVLLVSIVETVFAIERGRNLEGAGSALDCWVDDSPGGTALSLSVCGGTVIVAEVSRYVDDKYVWQVFRGRCLEIVFLRRDVYNDRAEFAYARPGNEIMYKGDLRPGRRGTNVPKKIQSGGICQMGPRVGSGLSHG